MTPFFNGIGLSGARPSSPSSSWEEEKDNNHHSNGSGSASGSDSSSMLAGCGGIVGGGAVPRAVVNCPPHTHVASAVNAVGDGLTPTR